MNAVILFDIVASLAENYPMAENFYSFKVKSAKGEMVPLSQYEGKVVLVVNVASKCGYTPQYQGLENLYREYKDKGFVILGFPCNQFGAQEPGTMEEIQEFCSLNYNVSFPIMGKVEVNGTGADPLYNWLKTSAPGILGTENIKWNFTKFLIGKDGEVVSRHAPQAEPKDLAKEISKLL
jgi:glutathione peroxidase